MTRVLLVIPTLDRSGAEKQMTLLACGLPRPEFEVQVVCLTRGGPYADVLAQQQIPVTILRKRGKFDPVSWWQLRQVVKRWRPDLIHTWLFAANAYGRLVAGGRRGPPVIVSERCVDSWKADWQHWVDRKLQGRTARLVGNSRSVVEFYRRRGVASEKLHLIPNGIQNSPLSVFTPGGRDELRKRELGVEPGTYVIGFIGRLAEQKSLPDLVWALAMLATYRPEVRVVLVGDGPERERLQQSARSLNVDPQLLFLGHRPDAAGLLPLFDAFVLPSQFEGMSNSLMEAMSAGVPAVASDILPNRELITHEQTGLLFPAGDRAELAKRIERLIQHPELAAQLAQSARAAMERDFGLQQMIDRYADLYRELAQRRAPLTPAPGSTHTATR